jgi:predicted amino acid-binding ACT domain protein
MASQVPVLIEPISSLIRVIRGQRVILDADLARLYGVTTKALNQAVKRNAERFPDDFMFQLTRTEVDELRRSRSQFVTLKRGANLKYRPYAFTEHGAIQAANVLNSKQAARMSVFVVRAFVLLRDTVAAQRQLAAKLTELEKRLAHGLDVHDQAITQLFKQLHQLTHPPIPRRRLIGFQVKERPAVYAARRKS